MKIIRKTCFTLKPKTPTPSIWRFEDVLLVRAIKLSRTYFELIVSAKNASYTQQKSCKFKATMNIDTRAPH